MSNPLRTLEDYELFLYTLTEQFPSAHRSTVILVRLGNSLARIAGELHFRYNIRLVVRERVLYHRLPAIIDWYGYEVWQGEEKLYWYDSQPHPGDEQLQSTHPHHKHVAPNTKHHRIPAPEMSFTRPNLPALIQEIEAMVKEIESQEGAA
jgi:hypothetical protein